MGCSLVSKALADPAQSLQEYPDLTSHIGADGDDVVGAMTSMFCTKYALSDEDCRLLCTASFLPRCSRRV